MDCKAKSRIVGICKTCNKEFCVDSYESHLEHVDQVHLILYKRYHNEEEISGPSNKNQTRYQLMMSMNKVITRMKETQ